MFLIKSSKILTYCLIILGFISCKEEEKAFNTIGLPKKEINTELQEKEWFGYIDSVYKYPFKNKKSIDSICLYYMKKNTPSVLAKPKFIIWRNAKSVKNGEFNLFIQLNNTTQFLIVSNASRNAILNEIQIDSIKIKESTKILLDLNNNDSLKDPCNQISKIEQRVTSQGILFEIEIFQSCFDKYFYEQLNYPFP